MCEIIRKKSTEVFEFISIPEIFKNLQMADFYLNYQIAFFFPFCNTNLSDFENVMLKFDNDFDLVSMKKYFENKEFYDTFLYQPDKFGVYRIRKNGFLFILEGNFYIVYHIIELLRMEKYCRFCGLVDKNKIRKCIHTLCNLPGSKGISIHLNGKNHGHFTLEGLELFSKYLV